MTTKAESRRRTAIKKALEADGYGVVVQHGSAYSPNVPDLLVVLAALEVKMDDGELRVGQRNRIRRFRQQGIPAGVVRSVEEARQGMARIKQGAYLVAESDSAPVDMSFLDQFITQDGPPAVVDAAPAVHGVTSEQAAANLAEPAITEVFGMAGQFETFDPAPASDSETPANGYQQVSLPDVGPQPAAVISPVTLPQPSAAPVGGFGILEHIANRLDDIYGLLADIAEGFQSPDETQPAAQPPVRRTRRGRPAKTAEE